MIFRCLAMVMVMVNNNEPFVAQPLMGVNTLQNNGRNSANFAGQRDASERGAYAPSCDKYYWSIPPKTYHDCRH